MKFIIKKIESSGKDWVLEIVRTWGADFIVSRGRKIYPAEIDGFYAEADNGEKVGLVTYEIIRDQCEIVTLDAFRKFSGIGSSLLTKVVSEAKLRSCKRVWLITLNDNLDAIRFYQKRGMTIAAVHINALEESRKIKPVIAKIGQYGIPLRDEIEFETML
ncbi:MAG: GNAT family N-acetyltransferase [Calditrichaeota bacterium]|nr:MAG: GNAT family N-acetyltransferase [Calditrichota bacterium]